VAGRAVGEASQQAWAEALQLSLTRVSRTLDETGQLFPLYCEPNSARPAWVTTGDGNWCAGYWIGLLWLAAKHAPSDATRRRYLTAAYDHLPALRAQPAGHIFAGLNHYYAGFLGYDVTGDPELRKVGLSGADMMLELYHPEARQIPIGIYTTAPPNAQSTSGPVDRRNLAAVDVIHTSIPILLRAYTETNRKEYRDVAIAHAQRHIEWHIREDGSTSQLTEFDRATGQPQRSFSTLAHSDAGCWSRGLAWSIAGLSSVFASNGDAAALGAVQRSAGYYAAHAGADLVPAWDLALADPAAARDASAAAIAACGLVLLRGRPSAQTSALVALGQGILESLVRNYLVRDPSAPNVGGVLHGCYRHPQQVATDAELIWTDFYVTSALDMLAFPQ
jgi:unsaturated chondroitin disaccharide hydrolase